MYMYHMYPVPLETRRGHWMSALDHWATCPAPFHFFFFLNNAKDQAQGMSMSGKFCHSAMNSQLSEF